MVSLGISFMERFVRLLNFFFLLLLAIATADHLPPTHPTPGILLCHINPLHFLLHFRSLALNLFWSLAFHPVWPLYIQPLSSISAIPSLCMSIWFQPCLSQFVSRLFNLSCPSHVMTNWLLFWRLSIKFILMLYFNLFLLSFFFFKSTELKYITIDLTTIMQTFPFTILHCKWSLTLIYTSVEFNAF